MLKTNIKKFHYGGYNQFPSVVYLLSNSVVFCILTKGFYRASPCFYVTDKDWINFPLSLTQQGKSDKASHMRSFSHEVWNKQSHRSSISDVALPKDVIYCNSLFK